MLVRYSELSHGVEGYAPFRTAVIRPKKKGYPAGLMATDRIMKMVKDNPKNEGITIAGKDWLLDPPRFLSLLRSASKYDVQLMIHLPIDLGTFEAYMGFECGRRTKEFKDLMSADKTNRFDKRMHQAIGTMILDHAITGEYYVMCGDYDEAFKCEDREAFGVNLPSSNMLLYYFKIDDSEDNDDESQADPTHF